MLSGFELYPRWVPLKNREKEKKALKKACHFQVPETLSFKMRPSAQPYYENEFYLHEKEKSLPYQNAQAILGCL